MLRAIVLNGSTVEQARAGQQAAVVLADTPFYGEAGGQLGDSGEIRAREGKLTVVDTERPLSGLWIHQVKVEEGRIRVGDSVEARVDGERRNSIRRHHTATHLLHLALRRVLGPHATQKGSRVGPTSLRFDFAHFEPLSPDQVTAIEDLVAREVLANHPVQTETLSFSEARQQGAIALFEENYGETVRLVTACPESKELCGGTHVRRTGDIGPVLITAQGSVAAGVRRLEAVAGVAAHQWLTERRGILDRAAALLKTEPGGLVEKVEKTLARERELVREVEQLKRKIAGGGPDLLERVRQIQGINVLGARVDLGDPTALREAADNLRGRLGSGVVCLGGEHKGKASVLVAVTGDLTGKLNAGKLIREVAAVIGGRGGGRPDLAQAGGPDLEKLDAAVDAIYGVVDRSQRHKEGES
jgi:alanyl-tRNA synthetase